MSVTPTLACSEAGQAEEQLSQKVFAAGSQPAMQAWGSRIAPACRVAALAVPAGSCLLPQIAPRGTAEAGLD